MEETTDFCFSASKVALNNVHASLKATGFLGSDRVYRKFYTGLEVSRANENFPNIFFTECDVCRIKWSLLFSGASVAEGPVVWVGPCLPFMLLSK